MSSLIAATFDRTDILQCEGHAYAIEKLILAMEKTAELSAIAELSARRSSRFGCAPIRLGGGRYKESLHLLHASTALFISKAIMHDIIHARPGYDTF
jgi:hypothetical protein